LLRVTVEKDILADKAIATLMGDDVESRKQFIVTNADDVRFLDI
jgi:DNA gyrase subunit B